MFTHAATQLCEHFCGDFEDLREVDGRSSASSNGFDGGDGAASNGLSEIGDVTWLDGDVTSVSGVDDVMKRDVMEHICDVAMATSTSISSQAVSPGSSCIILCGMAAVVNGLQTSLPLLSPHPGLQVPMKLQPLGRGIGAPSLDIFPAWRVSATTTNVVPARSVSAAAAALRDAVDVDGLGDISHGGEALGYDDGSSGGAVGVPFELLSRTSGGAVGVPFEPLTGTSGEAAEVPFDLVSGTSGGAVGVPFGLPSGTSGERCE